MKMTGKDELSEEGEREPMRGGHSRGDIQPLKLRTEFTLVV